MWVAARTPCRADGLDVEIAAARVEVAQCCGAEQPDPDEPGAGLSVDPGDQRVEIRLDAVHNATGCAAMAGAGAGAPELLASVARPLGRLGRSSVPFPLDCS